MAGLDANSTAAMSFDVDEHDHALTVTINGELDITNVDSLESVVGAALEREPASLIIELARVTVCRQLGDRAVGAVVDRRARDRAPRRLTNSAKGHRLDGPGIDTERETVTHTRTFPHEPESVPAARRFATGVLPDVSS